MSPAGPGANSDAAKLQHLVVGLRWKRVRNSSGSSPAARSEDRRPCSDGNAWLEGGLKTRSYIPKNRLIVEDSLCSPGSPMLRSINAA